jgi:CheY-like chemotaxis protein
MDTNTSKADAEDLPTIVALVVDGDRRSAEFVRAVLEPRGISVVRVQSAEEADLMLAAITPEVLLCDIALPGEDGLSFMRRLRKATAPAIRNVPTIAMTAAYGKFDARAVREAGFDVFLRKPPDPEQLADTVVLLVANRAAPSAQHPAE